MLDFTRQPYNCLNACGHFRTIIRLILCSLTPALIFYFNINIVFITKACHDNFRTVWSRSAETDRGHVHISLRCGIKWSENDSILVYHYYFWLKMSSNKSTYHDRPSVSGWVSNSFFKVTTEYGFTQLVPNFGTWERMVERGKQRACSSLKLQSQRDGVI